MSVESPPQVSALPPTWSIGFRRARLLTSAAARLRSTDLLSAFRTASAASQPAAVPTRPAMPAAVTSSPSPRPPFPWLSDYRLAPVIVLPVWLLMIAVLMPVPVLFCTCWSTKCASVLLYVVLALRLLVLFYYMEERCTALIVLYGISKLFLIPAFGEIFCQWYAKASASPPLSTVTTGRTICALRRDKSGQLRPFRRPTATKTALLGLSGSSMPAEPSKKSHRLLTQPIREYGMRDRVG